MITRLFYPASLLEDREGAVAMLGGKPTVLDALVQHGLLKPVINEHKVTLYDTADIAAAYGKARANPAKYLRRPQRED